jgi:hypothetical protein
MSTKGIPQFFGISGVPAARRTIKECIIVDIDGTLANNKHRQFYLEGDKKNWNGFFKAAAHDRLFREIRLIVNLFFTSTSHAIFLCTGRPSQYHELTMQWLREQDVQYTSLVMRAQGDGRPDPVIKKEMLEEIKMQGYKPVLAIDDRPEVVLMWRENGVPCLQADPSDWEKQPQRQWLRSVTDDIHQLRRMYDDSKADRVLDDLTIAVNNMHRIIMNQADELERLRDRV